MTTTLRELRDRVRGEVAGALPVEVHQSYAIPVRRGDKSYVDFLFAPSILRPREGLWLMPPSYLLEVEAFSEKVLELRAVTPADFGLNHDPQKALGKYDMVASGRTPEEFLKMQSRLYELYDLLAPDYLSGAPRADARRAREAREFRELFPNVAEQPLMPFYKAVGRDFFAWLER